MGYTPAETRDRILDAAQELFADQGFDAVSLRQITSQADVNIASVNYHFGSKDALIAEVFSRMLGPINEERLRLLDLAEADHPENLPIEAVLRAMYEPVIMHFSDNGQDGEVFMKLSGRCMGRNPASMTEAMMEIFHDVIQRFTAAFAKALPHLGKEDLLWRFHFAIGTKLFMLTKDEHLVAFSGGKISAMHDAERTLDQLIAFVAGGLKAGPVSENPVRKSRKAALTTAVTITTMFLASCAGTSPGNAGHLARVDVPKHWVASKGESTGPVADSNWVAGFGDKNLTAFVEKALVQNKDLKAAAARIEVAAASARITGADIYPQVDGTFSGRRSKQNFIGFPFGGGGEGGGQQSEQVSSSLSNQFGLSLDLSWEIDLWGRVRAAHAASIANFEASEADRATAELSVAAQAAKAWFAIAEAREQVALARRTVATFQETEDVIRDRFEEGIGQENGGSLTSQLLLSESDVATARDSLATRAELVQRTARQLEILAGEYPAGTAAKNARLPSLPSTAPTGLPADLLDRRPDILAAERRLAAADSTLIEAKKNIFPRLSLTTSGGTTAEEIENILNGNFSVWSIAGNAVQPILRAGVIKNGISLRKAEVKGAVAEFEKAALVAFADVENALAAEKFLGEREVALKNASDLAAKAYQQAREEYAEGTGDLLTMLTAQQRTFGQESQLISIRRQRLENRVDLHLALGGSFKSQPAKNEITQKEDDETTGSVRQTHPVRS